MFNAPEPHMIEAPNRKEGLCQGLSSHNIEAHPLSKTAVDNL
jgi:hypothetical protein